MSVPKTSLTIGGAVVAAFASAACCLGPLVLTILGIGGAASAVALKPYRPYLLVLTAVMLGFGFYLAYRRPATDCGPGQACEMPRANRAGRVALWIATIVILIVVTFPEYSIFLF